MQPSPPTQRAECVLHDKSDRGLLPGVCASDGSDESPERFTDIASISGRDGAVLAESGMTSKQRLSKVTKVTNLKPGPGSVSSLIPQEDQAHQEVLEMEQEAFFNEAAAARSAAISHCISQSISELISDSIADEIQRAQEEELEREEATYFAQEERDGN
eukprot:CAMPEP_0114255816 /NCGR_PEP_ID=MMETSP0058-20121206/17783_1 /TAXON_ID=36894 /ORGANISM="Pyramimonas parkeae, CCMP726" /LENGTH=158 /DNA_ID=CAMNT_0001370265 /DNA_START=123 /DNA_END=599 /DNA_ORIENTATION=+